MSKIVQYSVYAALVAATFAGLVFWNNSQNTENTEHTENTPAQAVSPSIIDGFVSYQNAQLGGVAADVMDPAIVGDLPAPTM